MARDSEQSTRRELLRKAGVAGAGATAGLMSGVGELRHSCAIETPAAKIRTDENTRNDNRITRENAIPGATDWQLTRVRTEPAESVRCPAIEGFCTRQSVSDGETLGN